MLRAFAVRLGFTEFLGRSLLGLLYKVGGASVAFAMHLCITRTLGASEAGILFLVLSLVSVASVIGRLGLDNRVVKLISSSGAEGAPHAIRSVVVMAVACTTFGSCIVAALVFALRSTIAVQVFNAVGMGPALALGAFAIPMLSLQMIGAQALQGMDCVGKALASLGILFPLSFGALLLLAHPRSASDASIWIVAAAALSAFVTMLWVLRVPHTGAAARGRGIRVDELLDTCLPLLAISLLASAGQYSSQFLLGWLGADKDVGLFTVALRVAMLNSFVLVGVNSAIAPRAGRLFASRGLDEIQKLTDSAVKLLLVASLVTFAVLVVAGREILALFGSEFRASYTALLILAGGQMINAVTGPVAVLLTMSGNERTLLRQMALGIVASIVAGIVLIPRYGVEGGAVATAVGVSLQNVLGAVRVYRLVGVRILFGRWHSVVAN